MNAVVEGKGSKQTVRIAAISDVHCKKNSKPWLRPIFEQIADEADILLVCGDITHWGMAEECRVFVEQAAPVLCKCLSWRCWETMILNPENRTSFGKSSVTPVCTCWMEPAFRSTGWALPG